MYTHTHTHYNVRLLNYYACVSHLLATLIEKMMDFIWQLVKVGIKDRTDDREEQNAKLFL